MGSYHWWAVLTWFIPEGMEDFHVHKVSGTGYPGKSSAASLEEKDAKEWEGHEGFFLSTRQELDFRMILDYRFVEKALEKDLLPSGFSLMMQISCKRQCRPDTTEHLLHVPLSKRAQRHPDNTSLNLLFVPKLYILEHRGPDFPWNGFLLLNFSFPTFVTRVIAPGIPYTPV